MSTAPRGTLDPWYVTGFVEGEGTFTYSRSGTKKQLFGMYFGIKLTGEDSAILEDIRDYFGVGKIYDVRARMPLGTNDGYTKFARYYRVTSVSDLSIVIDHFDEYPLRGVKAQSFAVWRQMVDLKDANFRKPPTEELAQLAAKLSSISVHNKAWVPPEGMTREQLLLRKPSKRTLSAPPPPGFERPSESD